MASGCGSGSCGCSSKAAVPTLAACNDVSIDGAASAASVNGVPLHALGQRPDDETLRQRACAELLRQAAQGAGLLAADDDPSLEGVLTAQASQAIEALIDEKVQPPEPDEAACRRHHAARPQDFGRGEAVHMRHVLFAITPGVDVNALRGKAEGLLKALRCAEPGSDAFASAARQWSNCPSGGQGGDLGWVNAAECAPEFAREVFGQTAVGVLQQLVRSRHGLHVVEVCEREAGQPAPFEQVQPAVASALRKQAWAVGVSQYLHQLAGRAVIDGVDLGL